MKNICRIIALIAIYFQISADSYSQPLLYGLSESGGLNDFGVIFKFDSRNGNVKTIFDCDGGAWGRYPTGSLIQATNGKLYGCAQGGNSGWGFIFEINPETDSFKRVIEFSSTIGISSSRELFQASNGKIYGFGGGGSKGSIFEFDPELNIVKKLVDFNSNNGPPSNGKPLQASDGHIYGMTQEGGNNYGGVFIFDILSSSFIKYFAFNGYDGNYPTGGMFETSKQRIFGLTDHGGSPHFANGTLIEYLKEQDSIVVRHTFASTDGVYPNGSIIEYSNGSLYFMAREGHSFYNNGWKKSVGVIQEFIPSTNSLSIKYDFRDSTINGAYPYGGLLLASNHKVYGMTTNGGIHDLGVLFEFDPVSNIYTKRLDFDGLNGAMPNATTLIEVNNQKWTGAFGTNWNDSNNWYPKLVPIYTTHVTIPSGLNNYPIIDTSTTILALRIDSGASVILKSGNRIIINQGIYNNGTLYIKDDASLIPGNSHYSQTGNGNYVVSRRSGNVSPLVYNFWSAPVTAAIAANLPGNEEDKYRFTAGSDSTSNFIILNASDALQSGIGYTASGNGISDTVTFTGLAHNWFIRPEIKNNGGSAIYNLIGNPYPSAINAKAFMDNNDSVLYRVVYLYSQKNLPNSLSTDDYIAINDAGSTSGFSGTRANTLANTDIGSCQGFMVAAKQNSRVVFSNAQRNGNNSVFMKKEMPAVWLDLINPDNKLSETLLAFPADATEGLDDGYDAPAASARGSLSLYSKMGNDKFSIQGMPVDEHHSIIPLGLRSTGRGVHTFKLGMKALMDEYVIELEDRQQRIFTDLETGEYKVTINQNQSVEGRFFLHLKSLKLKPDDQVRAKIYCDDKKQIQVEIIARAENIHGISVFDLTGRLVLHENNLNGKKSVVNAANLQSAIYVVSVKTDMGVVNSKIFIN